MTFKQFGLLGTLASVFGSIGSFFSSLWDTLFEKTIRDMLTEAELLGSLTESVIPDFVLDSSLGWFVLGAGLGTYLVYQLITWILNLIT